MDSLHIKKLVRGSLVVSIFFILFFFVFGFTSQYKTGHDIPISSNNSDHSGNYINNPTIVRKENNTRNVQEINSTLSSTIPAQEFYVFIGKDKQYLLNQMGNPGNITNAGTMDIYNYSIKSKSGIEHQTYSIKKGKIISAIRTIFSSSEKEAQNTKSLQILVYMSKGFIKQGTEANMTILKKGKRVLTIGYMLNDEGYYCTMIIA